MAFDTSAAHCAAALLVDGHLVQSRSIPLAKGQGEALIPFLTDLMSANATTWDILDAIGVGIGPGNFTGIRISVAAARGMALGQGIPAIGVSTLEAFGAGGPEHSPDNSPENSTENRTDTQTVTLDARGGKIYVQRCVDGMWQPPQLEPAPPSNETAAHTVHVDLTDPAHTTHLVQKIAEIAAARFAKRTNPRPAPLYIRPPDAALSKERPPEIVR